MFRKNLKLLFLMITLACLIFFNYTSTAISGFNDDNSNILSSTKYTVNKDYSGYVINNSNDTTSKEVTDQNEPDTYKENEPNESNPNEENDSIKPNEPNPDEENELIEPNEPTESDIVINTNEANEGNINSGQSNSIHNENIEPYKAPKSQKELIQKRDRYTKHYLNEDGTFTAVINQVPIHYLENEHWLEIDPTLVDINQLAEEAKLNDINSSQKKTEVSKFDSLKGEGYTHGMIKNQFKLFFSKVIKKPQKLEIDDSWISFQPIGVNPVHGEISKTQVLYRDAWKNTDLQYISNNLGLKEKIILNAPDHPERFSFKINLHKLTYEMDEEGTILLKNNDGEVKAIIPASYMEDAIGEPSNQVETVVSRQGNHLILTLIPDPDWLNSPDRVYPVVIDPSIEYWNNDLLADAYVTNHYRYTNRGKSDRLEIGLDHRFTGWKNHFTLLKFRIYGIPKWAVIKSANAYLTVLDEIHSGAAKVRTYRITESWREDKVDWSNRPERTDGTREVTLDGTGSKSFIVDKEWVQGWVQGKSNYGFVIESINYKVECLKRFYSREYGVPSLAPALEVVYDATLTPDQPNGNEKNDYNPKRFSWKYPDPNLPTTESKDIQFIIQKYTGSSYEQLISKNYICTEDHIYFDTSGLADGKYRWQVRLRNVDYTIEDLERLKNLWGYFYIDHTPPVPQSGKLEFEQNLNVDQNILKDKYDSLQQSLQATLTWNPFKDAGIGDDDCVYLQYRKNNGTWQYMVVDSSGYPVAISNASRQFNVEWNSVYEYRLKSFDRLLNASVWYPVTDILNVPDESGNVQYFEEPAASFATPAFPTEIVTVEFEGQQATVTFKTHNYADAYMIGWKLVDGAGNVDEIPYETLDQWIIVEGSGDMGDDDEPIIIDPINPPVLFDVNANDSTQDSGSIQTGFNNSESAESTAVEFTQDESVSYESESPEFTSVQSTNESEFVEFNSVQSVSAQFADSDMNWGTYTYTIPLEDYTFEYQKQYQFAIATKNSKKSTNPAPTIFVNPITVMVTNTAAKPPTVKWPSNGYYFTGSGQYSGGEVTLQGWETTDADGQNLTYTIKVWRWDGIRKVEVSESQWNGNNGELKLDSQTGKHYYECSGTLPNGHYFWKVGVTDGVEFVWSTEERYFYVDTTHPVQPVFSIRDYDDISTELWATNDSEVRILFSSYNDPGYNESIYPDDSARNNDVYRFSVSISPDVDGVGLVEIYKNQLDGDQSSGYSLPEVNGEYIITITSYDKGGNASYSNARNIIVDNQKPEKINLRPSTTYFSNEDCNVTLRSWPVPVDLPEGINSGIAGYLVSHECMGTKTEIPLMEAIIPITVKAEYNQPVRFALQAVDGAGNVGDPVEVTWYTLPKTPVTNWTMPFPEEIASGLYQREIILDISPIGCEFIQILANGEFISEKLSTDEINGISFAYPVESHKTYSFEVRAYNNGGATYSSFCLEPITVDNLPPEVYVGLSGYVNGYLNDGNRETTVTVYGYDYDNDLLGYQCIVKKDGEVIKETGETTFTLSNLSEGSTYEVEVTVTDGLTTGSTTSTFIVDTKGPQISVTEPASHYVASQEVYVQALDTVSGVAEIYYRWGESGEFLLPVDGIIRAETDGNNTLHVRAIDLAGNESILRRDYRIDLTPPEIDYLSIQAPGIDNTYYVSSNSEVNINFSITDDKATISGYRYGLIQEGVNPDSIIIEDLPFVSVCGFTNYIGQETISAQLLDGETYYPVLIAYNIAGRESGIYVSSVGFTVDGSAPEISDVHLTGLTVSGNISYLTGSSLPGIDHTITENDTSYTLSYGITDIPTVEPVVWYSSFDELAANLAGLLEGHSYYVMVKATNQSGLSSLKCSAKFVVDRIGPDFTTIFAGGKLPENGTTGESAFIQGRNDSLEVSWIVTDSSPIFTYYYKIGTKADPDAIGDISVNFTTADPSGWVKVSPVSEGGSDSDNTAEESNDNDNTTDEEGSGTDAVGRVVPNTVSYIISEPGYTFADGTYYIAIKAVDAAGNVTIEMANPIAIDSTKIIPQVKTDGIYTCEKNSIHFTVDLNSSDNELISGDGSTPANELIGYKYRIIDSTNSVIVDWKNIYTSEYHLDITESGENGLNLIDGEEYFIEVKALFSNSDPSVSGWASTTIDSTPPVNLTLNYPVYASNQGLSLSWNAVEDYSYINYLVKIQKTDNTDVQDWIYMGSQTRWTFESLDVTTDDVIFVTVVAENGSGLSRTQVSGQIIIDNTAPPTPWVIDGGLYTNDNTQLTVTWKMLKKDIESGLMGYEVALLKNNQISDSVNWQEVGYLDDNVTHTFTEPLEQGRTYYVAVKAINQAGLSSIGISDGILVDITRPDPPTISDTGEYTSELTAISAEFKGAYDPESGIEYLYYSLGTFENPTLLVNNQQITNATIINEYFNKDITEGGLSLTPGETYIFTGYARNGAGDISAMTSSDGITVVDSFEPRISQVSDSGRYTVNNQSLSFSWDINNPDMNFREYEYALVKINDLTGPIDTDSITGWKKITDRRIEISAEDISGVGQVFADGDSYALVVRVINLMGLPTAAAYSNGITVDASVPEIPELYPSKYVNNNFPLKWKAGGVHSGIAGYEYAIGTTRGGLEVTEGWRSIDISTLESDETANSIDRIIRLNLTHEKAYYLSVKARNGAGSWSNPVMSEALIADLLPPAINSIIVPEVVNTVNRVEGISLKITDGDSGVKGYCWTIVSDKNITGNLDGEICYLNEITGEYNGNNLTLSGLNLDPGTYYLAVQALDATGNWSSIRYSEPIVVDTAAPELNFTDADGVVLGENITELVTNTGSLKLYWKTNEPGTVHYRHVMLDAQGNPVNDPQFDIYQVMTPLKDVYHFDFEVNLCGSYQYEIYQVDDAGNMTDIKKIKVRYNFAPVVTRLMASSLSVYMGHQITFSADASDPDNPDGSGEVAKYIWIIGNEEPVTRVVGIDDNPNILTYTFNSPGRYQITVIVEDKDGKRSETFGSGNLTVRTTNTLEGELVLPEVWSTESLALWSEGQEYNLRGTVTVPEGVSLEILPGTVINFVENSSLVINGHITVRGTAEKPVVLRGTYWKGMEIYSTAAIGELTGMVIEGGVRGLAVIGNNALVSDSVFNQNHVGIHIYNGHLSIENCEFVENQYFGIKEDEGGNSTVRYCRFNGNGLSPYYDEMETWLTVEELNSLIGNEGNSQE